MSDHRQAAPLPINAGPEGGVMAQVAVAADTLTRATEYLDEALARGPQQGFYETRINERHIVRGNAINRISRARAALRAALKGLKEAEEALHEASREDR